MLVVDIDNNLEFNIILNSLMNNINANKLASNDPYFTV